MVVDQLEAQVIGALILARRAMPFWGTPTVLVYGNELTNDQARIVADLEVSSAVLVPLPLAEPGPTPSGGELGVLEGWVETWDENGRTLQLAVGDAKRWVSTRPRTWGDAATQTWGQEASQTWQEALVTTS